MPSRHGTDARYKVDGCRCDACKDAHKRAHRDYLQRRANGKVRSIAPAVSIATPVVEGPGRVEAAVQAEIADLSQAEARPGLAQTALELARLMDNPAATNQKAAAAGKLAELLDKLHKGADARKSKLAAVRSMTSAKSATG